MDDQTAKRYATIGTAFLGKVAERLRDLDPNDLSAGDVAKWTEVAMKLEQAGKRHSTYNRDKRLDQITAYDLVNGPDMAGLDEQQ